MAPLRKRSRKPPGIEVNITAGFASLSTEFATSIEPATCFFRCRVPVSCFLVGLQENTRLPTDPPPLPGVGGARVGATSVALHQDAPAPGVATSIGGVPERKSGPLVLLDLFHAFYRLGELGCKTSGAFYPFLGHLRDAVAIADPGLMQRAKKLWHKLHPSWTGREVDKDMRANYANKVLQHVPRTVPPPGILVARFDLVIDAFKDVVDAKTGKYSCQLGAH